MTDYPPPDEVRHGNTRHLGRRVWMYEHLDSTNARALALGNDPTHDGLVIVGREQSAGRGQYGRMWQAPARSSVLMSVLLFPPPALRRPAFLTSWGAVAVSAAIERLTGAQVQIKWPNDVLLAGKKVCGILIEQHNSGHAEQPLATVIGIGLNVTQPAALFQQAGLTLAGSLASQTGQVFEIDAVAEAVLRCLDAEYDRLLHGDFATLTGQWQQRLGLLDAQVRIEGLQQQYRGRLRDVTLEAVTFEAASGEIFSLAPEAIRHIFRDGAAPFGSANRV
jgi:BirA family transcriptional regulator, biotin operon repressor / biotin---[acetyl-CoA-carboxylase] ligase